MSECVSSLIGLALLDLQGGELEQRSFLHRLACWLARGLATLKLARTNLKIKRLPECLPPLRQRQRRPLCVPRATVRVAQEQPERRQPA